MKHYDLVVIGGGITGAGIFNLAARLGLKALLLEKADFASGTSSKSSKLVHGGLRYLKTGQVSMTWHCVRERQRLLSQAPGLIHPLPFLAPLYPQAKPSRFAMKTGLCMYDLMAAQYNHRHLNREALIHSAPRLSPLHLRGGFQFNDAITDDARLVLRLVLEGEKISRSNCLALNYSPCETLHRNVRGWIEGVSYRNQQDGNLRYVTCTAVINATGHQADQFHPLSDGERIRPLRGSHLVFPFWELPISQAISFAHPVDQRPVFALPWEGATIVGTTDLDHQPAHQPPRMSVEEKNYLLEALDAFFIQAPTSDINILSTFSGIRPVISKSPKPASQESRESKLWEQKGLFSITGGKLTTFRLLAEKTLSRVVHVFNSSWPNLPPQSTWKRVPIFNSMNQSPISPEQARLMGRYGASLVATTKSEYESMNLESVGGSPYVWWEIQQAIRSEKIVHLADLLLRRTRIGLLLPHGGIKLLEAIKPYFLKGLNWSDKHWLEECRAYREQWLNEHSIPNQGKRTVA